MLATLLSESIIIIVAIGGSDAIDDALDAVCGVVVLVVCHCAIGVSRGLTVTDGIIGVASKATLRIGDGG